MIEPLKTRAILFANRGAHHLQKHKHPSPSTLAPSLRDEIEKYTDVMVTLADLHPHRLATNDEQVVFIVKTPRPAVAGSIVGGKHVCLSAHALCNLILPMPERREF